MSTFEMPSFKLIISAMGAMFDNGKLLFSTAATVLGVAATLIENLKSLLPHSSVADETRKEEARIRAMIKLMKDLETQSSAESRAARQKLESSLNSMLARLSTLTEQGCKLREDPNYDLRFFQRLFLFFAPEGSSAFILHLLAYICMLAVPFSILISGYLQHRQGDMAAEYSADLMVLACYGALVFRAWALDARRWSYGYEPKTGVFRDILVFRRPVNRWMMIAQIFLWICLFWVVESLEDFCHDLGQLLNGHGPLPVIEELIKFSVPLLTATLCAAWAFAELKRGNSRVSLKNRFAAFRWPRWAALPMLACVTALGATVEFLITKPEFFDELPHEIALVLQSLIACVACSQWLSLISQSAAVVAEATPVRVKSAAA